MKEEKKKGIKVNKDRVTNKVLKDIVAHIEKTIFSLIVFFLIFGFNVVIYAETIDKSEFESEEFYEAMLELCDAGYGGNNDGVIDQREAEELVHFRLDLLDDEITGTISLKGIQHFKNISMFDWVDINRVANPQFTDYEYLYELDNLEWLSIEARYDGDFSFLEKLPNLTRLNLRNCNVDSFEFLKELKNLRYISLMGSTGLKDISNVVYCTELEQMELSCTDLSDISFFYSSNFNKLKRLDLQQTYIEDFSSLIALKDTLEGLTIVAMNEVEITQDSIKIVSELVNLKELQLHTLNLTDIPDLTKLTNLTTVQFGLNYITEEAIENAEEKLPISITGQDNWREATGLLVSSQKVNTTFPQEEIESSDNDEKNTSDEDGGEENTSGDAEHEVNSSDLSGNNDKYNVDYNGNRLVDGNIIVEGDFAEGAYLDVVKIWKAVTHEEDLYKYDLIEKGNNKLLFYDISVYKDVVSEKGIVKTKIQPSKGAKVIVFLDEVNLPEDGSDISVFRWEENGGITYLESTYENGKIEFFSDHFSVFSIVISEILDEEYEKNVGESDENNKFLKVTSICLLVVIVVASIVLYETVVRKRVIR